MPAQGASRVGRFSVDVEIANYGDVDMVRRGLMPPDQARRETIRGVVDSGAVKLVLPEAVVKRLGLPLGDRLNVRYADGRTAQRREAKGVFLKLRGRDGTFTAICEPKRETALISAIVLEDLDLLVDCANQQVVPRDRSGPIYEIE
jgi:hypothetical protein